MKAPSLAFDSVRELPRPLAGAHDQDSPQRACSTVGTSCDGQKQKPSRGEQRHGPQQETPDDSPGEFEFLGEEHRRRDGHRASAQRAGHAPETFAAAFDGGEVVAVEDREQRPPHRNADPKHPQVIGQGQDAERAPFGPEKLAGAEEMLRKDARAEVGDEEGRCDGNSVHKRGRGLKRTCSLAKHGCLPKAFAGSVTRAPKADS